MTERPLPSRASWPRGTWGTPATLGRPLRLAHRGDTRRGPENGIDALVGAAALPTVDGVEMDVRRSRDGVPVVVHDEDLLRVRGIARYVRDLRADELAAVGVPELAAVLHALPRHAFLDVELKETPDRGWVEVLAAGRGPDLERAVISSFEEGALRRMRNLAPAWPRWLNAERLDDAVIASALGLGCQGIAAHWRAVTDRSARDVASAGMALAAWTVRRRPTMRRLARQGVVAVCVEGRPLDG